MNNNDNIKKPKKFLKKKKKKKTIKRVFKLILSIFLILIIAGGVYSLYKLSKLNDNSVSLKGDMNNKQLKNKDFINILALGVDIGDPKIKGNDVPKRTDSMILLSYNTKKDRISLISIPRDTYVDIKGKHDKINAANVVGGVKCTIDTVEKLLNIGIDYYVKLDYSGFRKLIDAIGGIDMNIERNMNYDDYAQNLHIHFKKGTEQHLDGKKAEEFFRWRKNNDGSGFVDGDIGRIKNQHEFMNKVVSKVKSPVTLTRIPFIASSLPEYMETNMSVGDLGSFALKMAKVNKDNIKFMTLPGEGAYKNNISYYFYKENKAAEMLALIHEGNYSYINKDSIKIKILNETKKVGLAKNFKDYVEKKGYKNIETGNIKGEDKSKIVYKDLSDEVIEAIKRDFKIDNFEKGTEKDNMENCDIKVFLGYDHEYLNE